jgi:SAM-dependent methyltransferase
MSGFSADWLSLREPADHRARDAGLLRLLAAWAETRKSLTVLDLGCGTGSNARAVIPHLPGTQHWRLVDYDRALLDAARDKLAGVGGQKVGAVTVTFEEADLSRGIEPLLTGGCDLVTASALFDLASQDWLGAMVAALSARRLPLYTVLIYDGVMDWNPAHPLDGAVRDAFNTHQQGDKGFGAAAGPLAGLTLAARLSEAGYEIASAASPWVLGPQDPELMLANLEGIGAAVRETGLLADAELDGWLTARRRKGGSCVVGHMDLLALPR